MIVVVPESIDSSSLLLLALSKCKELSKCPGIYFDIGNQGVMSYISFKKQYLVTSRFVSMQIPITLKIDLQSTLNKCY